ncbi:S16 family serine protease [Sorangium sp. So ce542]|uniref:S16 family serine protease n=1 Tax=Sorangium sp. So ce542 TaxID=3133316 RepID=UPI003F5F4EE5
MRGCTEALLELARHVLAGRDPGVQELDPLLAAHLLEVRAKRLCAVVVGRTVEQEELHSEERIARKHTAGPIPSPSRSAASSIPPGSRTTSPPAPPSRRPPPGSRPPCCTRRRPRSPPPTRRPSSTPRPLPGSSPPSPRSPRSRTASSAVHLVNMSDNRYGPSAGVAFALAMLSAVTGRAVRPALAVTGELALHGNIPARRATASGARRNEKISQLSAMLCALPAG